MLPKLVKLHTFFFQHLICIKDLLPSAQFSFSSGTKSPWVKHLYVTKCSSRILTVLDRCTVVLLLA